MEPAQPFIGEALASIEETGIAFITMDDGYENQNYEPIEGWAKWFRDELGQTWVKFNIEGLHDEVIHVVWPADQVRCVEYATKPAPLSVVTT